MEKLLVISAVDNVAVALANIKKHETFSFIDLVIEAMEDIPIKHKIALRSFEVGETVIMYGVPIGEVLLPIAKGARLTTNNLKHKAAEYNYTGIPYEYTRPEVSHWNDRTFDGYHRKDGQVGTANYWLFIPMVFCQNRNLLVLKEAFETELGFKQENPYKMHLRGLISGRSESNSNQSTFEKGNRVFENIDGIKFLTHQGGCGGIRDDAQALVNLLASYIKNPNVAGASVLSLGCQHAQISMLQQALQDRYDCDKPVLYYEQQQYSSEREMLSQVVKSTYFELEKADEIRRKPAPLSKLSIGLECGGSDGLSGITANPLMGRVIDKISALSGKGILSEFPELCGVEQDLINRCTSRENAEKFTMLMETYHAKAEEVGSGFHMNPSPGNIKDGLITDAMKSAGAATKGGRGPVVDVLDYTEYATKPGLNLLCSPGNDVESTTALAGSGANLILFSTGLGTPTGNPICPVIKISSNSILPKRMNDIIDFDAGRIISEGIPIENLSEELIELIIEIASGRQQTKADNLRQDDFIPWKRGVSL